MEYRIFFDGRIVARGGRFGCSLGMGGCDLPAKALLPDGTLLVVGESRVVERWTVMPREQALKLEAEERKVIEDWLKTVDAR